MPLITSFETDKAKILEQQVEKKWMLRLRLWCVGCMDCRELASGIF
jgi:hypothetical protein